MNVSDEAVEAAGRAVFEQVDVIQTPEYAAWIARIALEAAAPHMLAGTKAEAIPSPYHPLGEGVHRVTGIRRSAVTNRYITGQ